MNSIVSHVTWKMMDEITMVTAHFLPLDSVGENFCYCTFFITTPCLKKVCLPLICYDWPMLETTLVTTHLLLLDYVREIFYHYTIFYTIFYTTVFLYYFYTNIFFVLLHFLYYIFYTTFLYITPFFILLSHICYH